MAYPLIRIPTLREFINKAVADFGATHEIIKGALLGPRGPSDMRRLIRDVGGIPRIAILPDLPEDTRLTLTVLRSLCQQLDIPPQTFGLTLG